MDEKIAKEIYDLRYKHGYMDEWPADKKVRVSEVIYSLGLPETGKALDFGCGKGVFTAVLKKALPNWDIFGCDISEVAIENAKLRIPDCYFFLNADLESNEEKYDLIFSHHVLEHVQDIEAIARKMTERIQVGGGMLHILPCGNTASFEFQLCLLRKNGIDKNTGLFFFEDKTHVRRMTTESATNLFTKNGLTLSQDYYSNQYYGAINWITRSNPMFILTLFNPLKGNSLNSGIKLVFLLFKFLIISMLRLPVVAHEHFNRQNRIIAALLVIPAALFRFFDNYLLSLSEREWRERKSNHNGSEMYLYFKTIP